MPVGREPPCGAPETEINMGVRRLMPAVTVATAKAAPTPNTSNTMRNMIGAMIPDTWKVAVFVLTACAM